MADSARLGKTEILMESSLPPRHAPGQAVNEYVLECERCQEPMIHLLQLVAEYPLCALWSLQCGECAKESGYHAWEDLPVAIRLAGDGRDAEEPEDLTEDQLATIQIEVADVKRGIAELSTAIDRAAGHQQAEEPGVETAGARPELLPN